MHPLRHPRNSAAVGIIFVVVAFLYWLGPYLDPTAFQDWAGITMLAGLGIAMSIMAYVLIAGSPRE